MRYKFRRANKSKRMGTQSVFPKKKGFILLKMKMTVDLIISVSLSVMRSSFLSLSPGVFPGFDLKLLLYVYRYCLVYRHCFDLNALALGL